MEEKQGELETNNQSDSEESTETQTTETVADEKVDTGANTETGKDEPTFSDPEMQKAWTQKTQVLADEKRTFEEDRKKHEEELKGIKQNADAFSYLTKDPKFVEFYNKTYSKQQEAKKDADISDEEFAEAALDKTKFSQLIDKVADSKIKPLSDKLQAQEQSILVQRLENDIDSYANTKDNDDFWELDKSGLIQPFVRELKTKMPKEDNLAIIQKAHQMARDVVKNITTQAISSNQKELEQKKKASIERGGRASINVADAGKKTIQEIFEDHKKQLGM